MNQNDFFDSSWEHNEIASLRERLAERQTACHEMADEIIRIATVVSGDMPYDTADALSVIRRKLGVLCE